MSYKNLEDKIRKTAKNIGIDIIGFSKGYSNKRDLVSILNKRKKENLETEFEEKDVSKRMGIKNILDDFETIIVIGLSYNFSNYKNKEKCKIKGKLSKSSVGKDYHIVLKEKAEKLIEEIEELKTYKYYFGADTTPLLEREIVSSSNIGYFGKNTNIINEDMGSYVFYGYILTNVKIEYQEKRSLDKLCGECSICQKACPTNALSRDYSLDTKRCISYLTQTKNKIPYKLREKMGFNIYGCDVCQNSCPKNKSSILKDFSESHFFCDDYVYKKDLTFIIDMDNKIFREIFKKTSSGWRGKNILRRNAIIAMGNTKNSEYIYYLEKFLKDESDMIKEYTAWAILKLDLKIGINILKKYKFKSEIEAEINRIIKYNIKDLRERNIDDVIKQEKSQ